MIDNVLIKFDFMFLSKNKNKIGERTSGVEGAWRNMETSGVMAAGRSKGRKEFRGGDGWFGYYSDQRGRERMAQFGGGVDVFQTQKSRFRKTSNPFTARRASCLSIRKQNTLPHVILDLQP